MERHVYTLLIEIPSEETEWVHKTSVIDIGEHAQMGNNYLLPRMRGAGRPTRETVRTIF